MRLHCNGSSNRNEFTPLPLREGLGEGTRCIRTPSHLTSANTLPLTLSPEHGGEGINTEATK